MTKEEWQEVKEALTSFYHVVELSVDGYKLELTLKRIGTYKNAVFIYVNGVFKGEWLVKDCEERRRFTRKSKKILLNTKDKTALKKLPKKKRQEWEDRCTYYVYDFCWGSFGGLKRHLERENESIELISIK